MSERFTKLFSLPENLYAEDCPVMICAGALSKDNQTNKVFVQLRFQNIDSRFRTLVAVKVAIQAFDIAEKALGGAKEYQYLDIEIQRGAEFGSKQPIYLDNATARSFSVSILEVVFEEKPAWTGSTQNWSSLQQKRLEEKFSPELTGQYQRDTFVEAKYEPFAKDGIWMCACGALNATGEGTCCRCRNAKISQFTALDHNTLANNLKTYTEKEMAEFEEKRKKSNIKRQKMTCIGSGFLVAFLIVLCLSQPQLWNQQYIGKLVGKSWSADDVSFTFLRNSTFEMRDKISDATFYGTWKMLNLEHREYSVDGTDFSGNAMRIEMYLGDDTEMVDVWFIDDAMVLIADPEGSWPSAISCQQS